MESASKVNSPVIVQFSNGGADFYAGKGLKSSKRAVIGAISGAKDIHTMAKEYGIPVVVHTDHASRKLLPWIDALMEANREHFNNYGVPLFSSHMIDLSEEPLEENIKTCKEYLKEMREIGVTLEIELGVTGGEEDGVDIQILIIIFYIHSPEEVAYAYSELMEVSDKFTIWQASFWKLWHGVYKTR